MQENIINPNIFRAYDIRGIYPDDINEDAAYKIGRAFVRFLRNDQQVHGAMAPKIVIGRDARPSSPGLFTRFSQGVLEEGADIIDIGLSSTPLFYFSVNIEKANGGAMITASHMPHPYNGLKLTRERAFPVSGETGIKKIQGIIENVTFEESNIKGGMIKKDFLKDYINFITKDIKTKNLKIVADTGNGMAGLILPGIFEKLKISYVPLYFEPDGSFPNHEANPIKDETLEDLKRTIIQQKADLGVAFDGDGDRVRFVTHYGEALKGDLITALLAEYFLKNNPGAKILYNVGSSRIVRETIEKNGGVPVRSRVGHSFVKQLMDEKRVLFGGEVTGHYYFQKTFNRESAVLAMLYIVQLITQENKSLAELINPFKKYFISPEINFTVKDIDKKIEEIKDKYSDGRADYLDGLTVEYSDWWFNVRPSQNDPVLRLNLEANSKELFDQKLKELKGIIQANS